MKAAKDMSVKTKYGRELTPAEVRAYKRLRRLIEREERAHAQRVEDHLFADVFRSYFKVEG